MQIFLGIAVVAGYLFWIVYHSVIKKDLRQHVPELYVYTIFITILIILFIYLVSID